MYGVEGEPKARREAPQRSPWSTLSNFNHIELPDLVLTSALMIFSSSTLLQAAASSFPILTAVSCCTTSQQKPGDREILTQGGTSWNLANSEVYN